MIAGKNITATGINILEITSAEATLSRNVPGNTWHACNVHQLKDVGRLKEECLDESWRSRGFTKQYCEFVQTKYLCYRIHPFYNFPKNCVCMFKWLLTSSHDVQERGSQYKDATVCVEKPTKAKRVHATLWIIIKIHGAYLLRPFPNRRDFH